MNNTWREHPYAYSVAFKPLQTLAGTALFLIILGIAFSPFMDNACACPANLQADVVSNKIHPLGSEIDLDSALFSYTGNPISYEWYGPFSRSTGPDTIAFIPEGLYSVSLVTFDGLRRSGPYIRYYSVEPDFIESLYPKVNKVCISWPAIQGTDHYSVFRSDENNPSVFTKIADVSGSLAVYIDYPGKEATFCYVVGAYVGGQWRYSDVQSAHTTFTRPAPGVNYKPVIYSVPILKGTVGIEYSYDVNAADPDKDALTYSLVNPPVGMAINAQKGLICWVPQSIGDYEITVKVRDVKGNIVYQTFIIEVDEMPPLNMNPVAHAGGPYTSEVDRMIFFNGSASYDPDGDPLQFAWSFGDGLTGTGASPSHSYSAAGTNRVTLTVSDGKGGTASDTTTATVTQCLNPTVQFSTDPSAVPPGNPCALIWASQNAASVSIDNGIGAVGLSGTIMVHPQSTTTYTITAAGPCGTAGQSVTVMVYQPPTVGITAVPGSIVVGQTSHLSWTSSNAANIIIDQGIGSVTPNGALNVTPINTTTYTITASGPGGTATASATVTVLQPPHVSISAQPQTILEGETSILTWSSDHADSASLDNGIGTIPVNGSITVSPANTTTYTITAQGPGGIATTSAVVTVIQRPTVTIAASLNPIDEGETTTLTWTTTNANSAFIDQGIGNIDMNGSMDVELLENTTFTITATGEGGTATASVTVEVLAPTAPRKTYAYIPNRAGDDVSVVDLQTNTVISHIGVGYWPYGVAVSPDGDTAYVTSRENGISIINTETNTLTRCIPLFSDTIAVNPDGKKLYGVSRDEGTLLSIDIASGTILDEIEVGPAPHGIAVNNEGTRIYVSSLEDGIVRVIDATTMGVISTVKVTQPGDPVWDVEVSPDGSRLYAVSSIGCKLTVINVRSNTVMDTRFYTESFVTESHLAVSPDGQTIALSDVSIRPQTIYLINNQSLDIMNLFHAQNPSDLDFTSDGQFIYCPDIWTGSVYVVDSWNSWLECTIEEGFADPHVYGHFIAEHKELVSGKVVSDGRGVEGIEVTLSNEFMIRTFLTDAQGRYYFHIPPGDYHISFPIDRYVLSQQELDVAVRSGEVVVPDMEVLLAVRAWSEPATIIAGESANLQWTSVKASSVSINHGIGNVGLSGIYTVSPVETTTYTVTATDVNGRSVIDQVTITVLQLPTVSLTADRQDIFYGETVSLSWTSTNAERVVLEPYEWDMGLSGTYTDTPDDTITYIITAYGPGGTATANVTVEVYYPPTVSLSAQPENIYAGQSSILTWTSSDAEHVSIDNGIGEVDSNGSMAVSPTRTTTYTITATGPGGTITGSATVTVNSLISLNITSPTNGAAIDRPDIMVRGTVTNAFGHETGITVNGMPAIVYGNQFFVNHVPLTDGENTITAHAVDTQGNMLDRTIIVTANITQPHITLSPVDSFGIAPFETTLRVDAAFTPDNLIFSDNTQGQIQYLTRTELNERTANISSPGVYYITAQAFYSSYTFTDTIGVVVYDRGVLDAMLRQKWEAMRTALLNNNIEAAVKDISSSTQSAYQDIFGSLTPEHRANLTAELGDIQLIKTRGAGVEYDIQSTRNNIRYSFILLFEVDIDGRWKIANF